MRVEMLFLIIGVLISSVSQLLLKVSADRAVSEEHSSEDEGRKSSLFQRFRAHYLNPWVIGAYVLLLIAMCIPLYALKFVDMKYVAIIESLGYVFVMILSAIFIHERITKRLLAGNMMIVAGVIIFGLNII